MLMEKTAIKIKQKKRVMQSTVIYLIYLIYWDDTGYLIRHFSQEDIQPANRLTERCLTAVAIKEVQIEKQ